MSKFCGVGVALVTPFDGRSEVDRPALERLVDDVTAGGADYLVVGGTTGECSTLDRKEKGEILRLVVDRNAGRLPVVAGFGGNGTRAVIDDLLSADLRGVDGILTVAPYYNKPSQEGLYLHYKAVAEASPVPVMLYNVPGRTGVDLQPETVLRLARDCDRVAAVKEASGSLTRIARLLQDRPEGFDVLTGDDSLALAVAALGGDGAVSVAANVFTEDFCRMFRDARAGRLSSARALHARLFGAMELLFEEGSPAGVKAALHIRGRVQNVLRLPLVPVSDSLYRRLRDTMEEYSL